MKSSSLKYFDIAWFSSKDGPGTRAVLFLQGCPLRCPWCHSPQSWEESSPLLFFEGRCLLCGACVKTCPNHVHEIIDGKHLINRKLCRKCGECIKKCPSSRGEKWNTGALGRAGILSSTQKLFDILKPQLELLHKIGGLTISGGEPLLQSEALESLLSLCQNHHYHTAIETSASVPQKNIETLIPLVNQWLVGLRLIDVNNFSNVVKSYGNWDQIISNLEFLAAHDSKKIIIRVPVIPGYTDKQECLHKISTIMKSLGILSIEILPYNILAGHYYYALGIPFTLEEKEPMDEPDVTPIRNYFAAEGFNAKIVS